MALDDKLNTVHRERHLAASTENSTSSYCRINFISRNTKGTDLIKLTRLETDLVLEVMLVTFSLVFISALLGAAVKIKLKQIQNFLKVKVANFLKANYFVGFFEQQVFIY